ncbi:MAG: hypothetical protein PHY34_05755 [Patescibacteria group bacterium]|nr:hypothetical protein [Patescibacteria group bacterium]
MDQKLNDSSEKIRQVIGVEKAPDTTLKDTFAKNVHQGKRKVVGIAVAAVLFVVILAIGAFVIVGMGGKNKNDNGSNVIIPPVNEQANVNTNEGTDLGPTISTNSELTVEGRVFVKGIDTPSESYGVETSDQNEIGLGKYDSKKEEFRPYIGDRVSVTFSSVCKSSGANCCKTLFYYCGTVQSWAPIE